MSDLARLVDSGMIRIDLETGGRGNIRFAAHGFYSGDNSKILCNFQREMDIICQAGWLSGDPADLSQNHAGGAISSWLESSCKIRDSLHALPADPK